MKGGKRALALRFGQNLAWHRKETGLSQERLGFRAELNRTEVGMLERGARLPRVDTFLRLAGSLGLDPGALLAGLDYTLRTATRGKVRFDNDGESGS